MCSRYISNIHVVSCRNDSKVEIFITNGGSEVSGAVEHEVEAGVGSVKVRVGDWTLVTYDGKRFPGEKVSVSGSDTEESVIYHARKRK